MKALKRKNVAAAFEKALAAAPPKSILRLYVAGATERSRRAILRARQLCESELAGNYELEVIDVYQQATLAREGNILATPTLVREFPLPVRRLIGDLSNTAGLGLLIGLDVTSPKKVIG